MFKRFSTSLANQRKKVIHRTFFISTEPTPNPQSLKFLPGKQVLPEEYGTGMQFDRSNLKEISRSRLVKSIFGVQGVRSVFLGKDFVAITKDNGQVWNSLKPEIFTVMMDFYEDDYPVIEDTPMVSDTTILDSDSEIVATIKELLETKIRPSVQDDGGDIFFVSFDELTGLVSVRLAGSCVGCPSSSVTLRNGVEKMLMHYIPEVKGIQEVTDAVDDEKKLEFAPNPVHGGQSSSAEDDKNSTMTY